MNLSAVSSSQLVKLFFAPFIGWLVLVAAIAAEPDSTTDVVKTIYAFQGGADGFTPVSGLTIGPNNTLYGATQTTVFQLKEDSAGTWSETPISTTSLQSLIGTSTALYGVTGLGTGKICKGGNDEGCGEVVELTPATKGSVWRKKVIYEFKGGEDGVLPAGIAFGPNGDIYGTTTAGGNGPGCGSTDGINRGCGTLFQLTMQTDNKWTETVLHRFQGGSDGAMPFSAPSFDAAGNVYGSTNQGGGSSNLSFEPKSCDGNGTVYEYSIFAGSGNDYFELWKAVCKKDGLQLANSAIYGLLNAKLSAPGASAPNSSATASTSSKSANGAIFTTEGGGDTNGCAPLDNNGCGGVAELTEPANGTAPWHLKILHAFESTDGALPNGNLVAQGDDTLYGVATYGGIDSSTCQQETFGPNGCGVLYKLVKSDGDWTWEGVVYKFRGAAHGAGPNGELLNYKGKIYGMTADGGSTACGNAGCGTIFQLIP